MRAADGICLVGRAGRQLLRPIRANGIVMRPDCQCLSMVGLPFCYFARLLTHLASMFFSVVIVQVRPTTEHHRRRITGSREGQDRIRGPPAGHLPGQKVYQFHRICLLQAHLPTIRRSFLYHCRRHCRQRAELPGNHPPLRRAFGFVLFQCLRVGHCLQLQPCVLHPG